jgi:diadenosine tetraphosphate (Ap4A) HIT family hydrolase
MDEMVRRCISCEIVAGRRIEPGGTLYQDDCWHVGSVLEPVVWRGFTIVKLRRHCEHLAQLTPKEAAGLGPVLAATCQALSDVLHPARVFMCSFGDGVRHVHFWALPRPPEMRPGMHPVLFNLDLRLALTRLLGLKRWRVPPEETAATAVLLRARLVELLGSHPADF